MGEARIDMDVLNRALDERSGFSRARKPQTPNPDTDNKAKSAEIEAKKRARDTAIFAAVEELLQVRVNQELQGWNKLNQMRARKLRKKFKSAEKNVKAGAQIRFEELKSEGNFDEDAKLDEYQNFATLFGHNFEAWRKKRREQKTAGKTVINLVAPEAAPEKPQKSDEEKEISSRNLLARAQNQFDILLKISTAKNGFDETNQTAREWRQEFAKFGGDLSKLTLKKDEILAQIDNFSRARVQENTEEIAKSIRYFKEYFAKADDFGESDLKKLRMHISRGLEKTAIRRERIEKSEKRKIVKPRARILSQEEVESAQTDEDISANLRIISENPVSKTLAPRAETGDKKSKTRDARESRKIANMGRRIANLLTQNAKARKRIAQLETSGSEKDAQIGERDSQIANLTAQIFALESEKAGLVVASKVKTGDAKKMQEEIANSTAQITKLEKEKSELIAANDNFAAREVDLLAQNTVAEEKLRKEQERARAAEAKARQFDEIVEARQKAVNKYLATVAELKGIYDKVLALSDGAKKDGYLAEIRSQYDRLVRGIEAHKEIPVKLPENSDWKWLKI